MHFLEVDGRRYAQFERLRRVAGLVHGFSTKPIDLSLRADGRASEWVERRKQVAIDFGLDPERLYHCVQVHEGRVAVLNGSRVRRELDGFDAVTTAEPGLGLMTFSADCALVLIYDPVRRVVGMAHASWRCTVASITRRLVETVQERFGCQPTDLHAGVGPSAGPTRYEVGENVYEAAANLPERERLFPRRGDRMYFDLWEASRSQLALAGVPRANIEVAGICTISCEDLFYSYRREGPGCGHFCLFAGMDRTTG